ncbi:DUF4276 domain-containing protein [Flavobacterium branchiophilum]|uniref:DUF4276 family protein n=1 Tax=Flavobacterium branchiophilum (strain FL-15) TaxID=1034807 RepID=G2Z4X5_FLABF|nr:DUF4276 family protein [Flavobacterium branchiophilum]CCB70688.1 Protein of unknown function [Flavobacterium branchiophilum FL-15]
MKHLYIIVEGPTELEFVDRILIPYFNSKGITTHIQGIAITMSGGGHGFNNIKHFENTIKPVLNYKNEPFITTLIDYFKLNSETKLPGFLESSNMSTTDKKLECLENKLNDVVQKIKPYNYFIPYIQKHEMETLMFANPEMGFSLEDENIKNAVVAICNQYPNIEDINSGFGPSERLEAIYKQNGKKYNKIIDGMDIAELTGIEKMLEKSYRFRIWIEKLTTELLKNC